MRLTMEAPGKVNLCLLVGPRRADGYHDLFSVFAPVDLCDRLSFDLTLGHAGAGEPGRIDLDCPGLDGDDNLVVTALRSVERVGGRSISGTVTIEKHIPVGAGMGGGSSDAAAALRAAARLLEEEGGVSLDERTLHGLARQLGADVPFFLEGRTAIGTGIGDVLEPVVLPSLPLVLLLPEEHLSTATVYGAFDRLPGSQDEAAFQERVSAAERRWGDIAVAGGSPDSMVGAIAQALENDLEAASLVLLPALASRKDNLLQAGALGVLMSGSGPTLFGVCASEDAAVSVAVRLAALGYRTLTVTTTGGQAAHADPPPSAGAPAAGS